MPYKLKISCPACMQGPTLTFLTCPSCQAVIVACDEAGCVYANPVTLGEMWPGCCDVSYSTMTKCPHCLKEHEFAFSTHAEIMRLGISRSAIMKDAQARA
jgi:hypothetical protein